MQTKTYILQAAPASISFEFSGEADIVVEAAPADGSAPKLPRFSMVAYTGGPMRPKMNPPLKHAVVVDLAGLDISSQNRPALKDHNPQMLVGHTDSIASDGRQLTATGVISGVGQAAREVRDAAANGFTWQVSMGASVENLEFVDAKQTVNVNGRNVSGPVYVARSGRVRELSFLTLGADDNTSARIAAENAAEGNPMNFEQWLKAKGFDLAALNDQTKQYLQAQFDAEQADDGDTTAGGAGDDTLQAGDGDDADDDDDDVAADTVKTIRAAYVGEKKRLAKMGAVTAKYAKRVPADKMATIEATAVEQNWDEHRLELELIRAERPAGRSGNGGGGSGAGRHKLTAAVIVAAMSLSAGFSEEAIGNTLPAAERERVMNEATSGQMRGYSLHALMDANIHAAGMHFSGSRKSNDFIRTAVQASKLLAQQSDLEADGFSTMSLSNILSNVANKGLLASYTAVEVCWPNICGVRNHSDFKVHTRYRLDSTGAFKKVGPDGELKNVGLTDAAYTNQLGTFGAIIALTRQMMINDDLGAFMEIPNLLGRMAALRLEEAVFVLLLSNPSSFFGTGNKNYMSGNTTPLGIDSLTVAAQKFADFVDSNGKPILVTPDRLLVGSALRTTAEKLNRDTTIIADGIPTTARSIVGNGNPHVGRYKPFTSPYLNNTSIKDQDGAAITGQSSTLWLLLADPAVRAAIAVAFLNGQRAPTIESSQTEFDTLGMQWRAYHDFGVGMEETTAAVESAGA